MVSLFWLCNGFLLINYNKDKKFIIILVNFAVNISQEKYAIACKDSDKLPRNIFILSHIYGCIHVFSIGLCVCARSCQILTSFLSFDTLVIFLIVLCLHAIEWLVIAHAREGRAVLFIVGYLLYTVFLWSRVSLQCMAWNKMK